MRTLVTFLIVSMSTFLGAQGVVINEFIASNDSTSNIMDDFGEYDDWAELYNNSNQAVDLSGYYFSDDTTDPLKWRFPNGISIAANGFLIVWTDSDDEQGDLHTSFKLSKSGEALILSDSFMVVLDSITFGEQETNVSMARIPNGTGDFTPRAPTFNADNEFVSTSPSPIREDFDIYPNPANADIRIDFSKTTGTLTPGKANLQISDASGKAVLSEDQDILSENAVLHLNVSRLAAGMYILKIETESEVFLKKIMVEKHD